ncbi:MAG: DNA polymerase/3'-5' exonuclease PolX [Patescibacteria group bacterium]|nr:DNA polymerase/3'-5' exonuclease PolX [Patescibacteria group bacterium]
MKNSEVAEIFYQLADILEILNDNQFKIKAYRRAAQIIESLSQDIQDLYKKNELQKIAGIGRAVNDKTGEIIQTGTCQELKKLIKKVPRGVVELLQLEGLGPKTVSFLYNNFKIKNIQDLKKFIQKKGLRDLKGFGQKTEENILKAIDFYQHHQQSFLLGEAFYIAQDIKNQLAQMSEVDQVEIAGSLRRMKEVVGDLDILITSRQSERVMEKFVKLSQVKQIRAQGKTKTSVVLKNGLEVDLRVVKPENFGAALHYFTGSKNHNIHVRKLAISHKLKINEYGVFKKSNHKFNLLTSRTEKSVYGEVGLKWIAPELREDRGEVEASLRNKLPKIIELKDIQGDLHCHTNWSDGEMSLQELAEAGIKRGYQYIGVSDHASGIGITHGLNDKRLLKQIQVIRKLNQKFKNKITILAGTEVDILSSGELYIKNEVLKKLDYVIAGVHQGFKMPREKMTQRILTALANPYVKILAHPTGRLINKREGYEVDLNQILAFCAKNDKILELNSHFMRLDLNDINCRRAKEMGAKIIINTDAHSEEGLDLIHFGVATARRGWLEKPDVVNTWSLKKLRIFLKK